MTKRESLSELEFLENYSAERFARPNTSVDTVIFTVKDESLQVLLIKRASHPFKDTWSLVGGYIDIENDTDLVATAKRKLEEKTGVKTPYLEQFKTVGNKTRDPRGWSVTTVYFALISESGVELISGQGATDIRWSKVEGGKVKEKLGFDHGSLLKGCWERLKNKVLYTTLPIYLMPQKFSLRDLQNIYELILEQTIDHKSFRRRILSANILEETKELRQEATRPARLYKVKKSAQPHFFTRNIEGPLRSDS